MPHHDPLDSLNLDDLTPEQREELLERVRSRARDSASGADTAALTEILCVIDRSGSMQAMRTEAIGGFNHFLEEQRTVPGRALLSLVLFDHEYDLTHEAMPIEEVPPLSEVTYVPRGTTALHDAIGRTIDEALVRHRRRAEDQRPDKVVMCILTDGLENASRDYNGDRIRDMITSRRHDGWEFVFLAANQDAVTTARHYNIPAADAASFWASGEGTDGAFRSMSSRVVEKRASWRR